MFRFLKSIVNAETMGEEIIHHVQKNFDKTKKLSPGDDPHMLLNKTYLSRLRARGEDINSENIIRKSLSDTMLLSCLPEGQDIRGLALTILFKERPDIEQDFPKFRQDFELIMGPFFKRIEEGEKVEELYFSRNKHRQIDFIAPELTVSLKLLAEQLEPNHSKVDETVQTTKKAKPEGRNLTFDWDEKNVYKKEHCTCPNCNTYTEHSINLRLREKICLLCRHESSP